MYVCIVLYLCFNGYHDAEKKRNKTKSFGNNYTSPSIPFRWAFPNRKSLIHRCRPNSAEKGFSDIPRLISVEHHEKARRSTYSNGHKVGSELIFPPPASRTRPVCAVRSDL